MASLARLEEPCQIGLNSNEDPRFVMLVTIRDYAHERLAESDDHKVLRAPPRRYVLDWSNCSPPTSWACMPPT